MHPLYSGRFLSQGYPDLAKEAVSYFSSHQDTSGVLDIMDCCGRLIDLSTGSKSVTVVGCGPNPRSLQELLASGYDATGIEPVVGFARRAAEAIGDPRRVQVGTAECTSLAPSSQRVVLLESVLEHVESPAQALAEAYRVLEPGGVLFVYTTNRTRLSLTGRNDEFRVRFYNWFPAIVKECYVYKHLHYDPELANYSLRPAVHWFTFAELCERGRQAGFAQFYSLLDLVDQNSPAMKRGLFRRTLVNRFRFNPWLRALALVQFGSSIFMLKRL